jgi:hypothetical protein
MIMTVNSDDKWTIHGASSLAPPRLDPPATLLHFPKVCHLSPQHENLKRCKKNYNHVLLHGPLQLLVMLLHHSWRTSRLEIQSFSQTKKGKTTITTARLLMLFIFF